MNARSGFLTTAVQAIALAWMLVLCPPGGVPPAAGAVSTYVNITAPSGVTTVGGTITIATSESANIRWINVFIDDVWVGSNPYNALPPYLVSWNSSTVADGKHKLSVTGYDISQGGDRDPRDRDNSSKRSASVLCQDHDPGSGCGGARFKRCYRHQRHLLGSVV